MDATPLEIRDALMGYWFSNYTSHYTYYPNTNPNDIPEHEPWLSFDIRFTTSETIIKGTANGGTLTRHRGVVFIEIHTQPLTGTRTPYNIATEVCNLMERKRIGGVVTRNANIQELSLDSNYSILVAEIPFLST